MKRFITTAFLISLVAPALAQTSSIYENFGTVSDSPQIDARAFANYGVFTTFSSLPYDFQSTLYFTNKGTMFAFPGFRFADASSSQPPFRPAVNFFNDVGGLVIGGDTAGLLTALGSSAAFGFTPVGNFSGQIISPSYLLVTANQIVNKGILQAGAAGLVQLTGDNVDLSRSGVGVARLELSSTHFETATNFFPDPGIYDRYWELTNQAMGVGSLLRIANNRTNATSPSYTATNGPLAAFASRFPPLLAVITNTNSAASTYTNVGGSDPATGKPTNITRQAVFVAVDDPNIAATIKWALSPNIGTLYETAVVELKMGDTNILTGDPEPSTLYFQDFLASDTNYTVIPNSISYPTTYRPAPFVLSRTAPPVWLAAGGGKGTLTNTFFYDPKDTNFVAFVTNTYAAYGATIDSLASPIPDSPGASITDAPGRVEIIATNLNLTRTRLRGTGLIAIHTQNLVASTDVNVDAENVVYDLTSPPGDLNIKGIAKENVVRLNGDLAVWSAVFTNFLGLIVTNTIPDPSGTGTTNQATNIVVEIDYHMLIIDATGLQSTKPVVTHDLILHSDRVSLSDPILLVRSLILDAKDVTLNSRLILSGAIENWGETNAPRLSSFTMGKAGLLSIPNVGNFGQDTRSGYNAFTNNGVITANGLLVRSGTFISSGILTSAVEGITIEAESAQFQNSTTLSARDLIITGSNVRFTAATNASTGALVLNVSDSLSDSGGSANNIFTTHNGFQLAEKPAAGDLLGTTIHTIAPRFAQVEHIWAGDDRGASAAGFQDNVALGRLVLDGDREVLLSFRGANRANGMYVDFLELSGPLTNAFNANDLGSALLVDPSLTIYFADSNVAADQLEQQSGGRLVHVDFAGPADFVQVPVRSGGTVQMSQSIRNSASVDSDGDGIPNALDAFPLDPDTPLRLTGSRANQQTSLTLSWLAQPRVNYQIEFTTNLQTPDWQSLSSFTNPGSTPQTAVIEDHMTGDHAQRYYRVRTGQ